MTIRELTSPAQFDECMELQREGFGRSDLDLMPMRFFVVAHHVGGLVLGAFDGSKLIGYLVAIPGIRKGMPYWHSHMLTVTESHRNLGIGAQLKMVQKERALKQGIRLIEWTFDPLVSRNAYLNIEKLGVIVCRYHSAFYGGDMDRLIAEWWLDRPRPAVSGAESDVRRVSIPADADAAKGERLRVRDEFLALLKEDYYVAAFERRGETSDYILIRGASGADFSG